jgi:XisH protein
VAEPFYDLAWERNNEIWVAEVKSLTRRSEERQLRLAVGQVLRYAQQLESKDKPVVKVIAVEEEPIDGTLKGLCLSLGVRLVWPATFGQLTRAAIR